MHLLEWLFVVALFFYTLVIWTHKFTKELSTWMVALFGVGLMADVLGTIFVCVLVINRWVWNFHTTAGLSALLIMALHFIWALLALSDKKNFRESFSRFSVYAWVVWLLAFISGIPR